MTVAVYPDIVLKQDLAPDHFGSEIDELCEQIRSATKVRLSIWKDILFG